MSAPVAQDGDRITALHCAAINGHPEVARLLLASGADVNAKVSTASGCRLLQPPARVGRRSNGTGWESGASRLAESARIAQGYNDMTALHLAAVNGRLEVARLLLESGADVNAKVTVAIGCRLLQLPLSGWQAFQWDWVREWCQQTESVGPGSRRAGPAGRPCTWPQP